MGDGDFNFLRVISVIALTFVVDLMKNLENMVVFAVSCEPFFWKKSVEQLLSPYIRLLLGNKKDIANFNQMHSDLSRASSHRGFHV